MFTGIVRELGRVLVCGRNDTAIRLQIDAPTLTVMTKPGDSVSVEGCCLTIIDNLAGALTFDVVHESLERTTLGSLSIGDDVNLEPALRAGEPLGGHYVQGHVDGVGRVVSVEAEGESRRVWIDTPPELLRYCVEKGSIAVAGVSLTITAVRDGAFEVALIPHTLEQTTLGDAQPGDELNIEVDILAKYVEKLVHPGTISNA
jgi:riboflavin synthase